MRKCRGIAEVAAVEMAHVGVRTRARALAMAGLATANKRRKIVGAAGVSKNSRSSSVQLRSRCRRIATPLTSADQLFSGSRSDHMIASCCSSNASSRIMESEDEVVQIETHSIERRENSTSSEMEAESGELESTATLPEANSRSKATVQKSGELESIVTLSEANSGKEATAKKSTGSVPSVPSEAELEEFFGAEFIELEKRFREKYNFDFENGVPLEGGRYEWARVDSEEEN